MLSRIRKSFRRTFRRSRRATRDEVDARPLKKHHARYKVALLDGTDLTFDLEKTCLAEELIKKVLLNLDLVEKDYFGLQFMDTNQVPHWLDPSKRLKKQVKIGPPYTVHFRVKFYAADPQDLHEELTRYHFFMQIKQDILRGKLVPTKKQLVDLCAYAVQSELGDYDPQLHQGNYVSEFRFTPNQDEELERAVARRHKALLGMNPADCEVNYLKIARRLDQYGIDFHEARSEDGKIVQLGLCARGIQLTEGNKKAGLLQWPHIVNISFTKQHFTFTVEGKDRKELGDLVYNYALPNARASKHLWKCAVEYHSFFRMVKTEPPIRRRTSFLKLGSRFRYSGRTLHQATEDDSVNARKSIRVKRARSERFSQRSTIGYIRVGSRVWAKAFNGDYYRGQVTDMKDKVYIKFENGDTVAHERGENEALVYDMDPNPSEVKLGTRVIAHWSGLSAYLPGSVTRIEGNKYFVLYDDGDTGSNGLQQMRILKPPLFFGPGSGSSNIQKRLSMKATALMGPGCSFSDKAPRPRMVPRAQNPALQPTRNGKEKMMGSESDDAFFSEFDTMNEGAAVQRPEGTRAFGLFGSRSSSSSSKASAVPSRSNSSAARMQRGAHGQDQKWDASVTKSAATTDDVIHRGPSGYSACQYPTVIQSRYRRVIHDRVQRDKTLRPLERRRASISFDIIFADTYLNDEEVRDRKRRGSVPRSWKIHVPDRVDGGKSSQKRGMQPKPQPSQQGRTQQMTVQQRPTQHSLPQQVANSQDTSDCNSRQYTATQNMQKTQAAPNSKPACPPTKTRLIYQGKAANPVIANNHQRKPETYIITEL